MNCDYYCAIIAISEDPIINWILTQGKATQITKTSSVVGADWWWG